MWQVYEYEYRYDLDGKTLTGRCHTVGRKHDVGDSVDVILEPNRPDSARIANSRRCFAPRWVVAIPLVVLILLGVGIVGNSIFNCRTLGLARNGNLAIATRNEPGRAVEPGNIDVSGAELSLYQFHVDEYAYPVDRRSWATGREETIPVLYSPEKPRRNVGLDRNRWVVLSGAKSPWSCQDSLCH